MIVSLNVVDNISSQTVQWSDLELCLCAKFALFPLLALLNVSLANNQAFPC